MPQLAATSLAEGFSGVSMLPMSHIVTSNASGFCNNLCGAFDETECDTVVMPTDDKNGGPNHLKAWREYRKLTQEELAERVGTSHNMIGYLESGTRGLSAKWLRKLADALETTPGMILDHDPNQLDSDILDIWASGDLHRKRQLSEIAKALVRTGTKG